MDELTIRSGWLRKVLSKLIERELKKRGIDMKVSLGSISIKIEETRIKGHMEIDVDGDKSVLEKIL